jgi:hypothetical protein
MTRSSAGKEAVKLARMVSSCAGWEAGSNTSKLPFGLSAAELASIMGFVVAIFEFCRFLAVLQS